MKLLLLGAGGQLGRELSAHVPLLKQHTVIPLLHAQLNIADLDQVLAAYQDHQPDLVINAAAFTKVDLAEKEIDAAFKVNAVGAANLAKACEKFKIPLIHFSTDYVFDGEKNAPYTEKDEASPLNVYGRSKWEGETLVRQLCEKHIILRVSWVFGAYGHNFVKTILKLAREKTEISIVHDQKGSPTPTIAIADAVFNIIGQIELSSLLWGTYHFCGMPIVSWYEFAQKIIEIAKESHTLQIQKILPITSNEYVTPAKRPKNSILSCEKIAIKFNIQPAEWILPLTQLIQNDT